MTKVENWSDSHFGEDDDFRLIRGKPYGYLSSNDDTVKTPYFGLRTAVLNGKSSEMALIDFLGFPAWIHIGSYTINPIQQS